MHSTPWNNVGWFQFQFQWVASGSWNVGEDQQSRRHWCGKAGDPDDTGCSRSGGSGDRAEGSRDGSTARLHNEEDANNRMSVRLRQQLCVGKRHRPLHGIVAGLRQQGDCRSPIGAKANLHSSREEHNQAVALAIGGAVGEEGGWRGRGEEGEVRGRCADHK